MGGKPGSGDQSGTLAGTVTKLHKRLDRVRRVSESSSCEQLLSSIRLLTSDIDVAVAEAKKLEAMDEEEKDLGQSEGEDTPAKQLAKLHEQVAPLDSIAKRVGEIEQQL